MVMLRVVFGAAPAAFQSLGLSAVSWELPSMRQWTSAPCTSRVSTAPERSSMACFCALVGADRRKATR